MSFSDYSSEDNNNNIIAIRTEMGYYDDYGEFSEDEIINFEPIKEEIINSEPIEEEIINSEDEDENSEDEIENPEEDENSEPIKEKIINPEEDQNPEEDENSKPIKEEIINPEEDENSKPIKEEIINSEPIKEEDHGDYNSKYIQQALDFSGKEDENSEYESEDDLWEDYEDAYYDQAYVNVPDEKW